MNLIQVSIIFSYWDNQLVEVERSHEFSMDIKSSVTIDEFEEELTEMIMRDKGDGLFLDIYSIEQRHYVDVFLLLGEPDQSSYDISYLRKYLEKFEEIEVNETDDDYSEFDSFIYLEYAPTDLPDIMKILEDKGIKAKVISERRSTYERGAGDYFLAYLIGLASSMSVEVIKKINSLYNDHVREVQSGEFPVEIIRRNLAEKTGEDTNNLALISFEELPGSMSL